MAAVEMPSWPTVFTAVLAAVFGWQIWSRIRARWLHDLHKIPGPTSLPVIGNAPQLFMRSIHINYARWAKQFGSIYKFSILSDVFVVISDPQEVLRLTSRQEDVPKWHEGYRTIKQRAPYYNILGTPDEEEWKHVRRTTNVAFSPNNIRQSFPLVHDMSLRTADLMAELCRKGSVEVDGLLSRMIAEIFMKWAYDEELHALELVTNPDGTTALAPNMFLQRVRIQLKQMGRQFSNPLYDVLLKTCPWLPTARQEAANHRAVDQGEDDLAGRIRAKGFQPETNTSLWACLGRLKNYKDGTPIHPYTLATNIGLFMFAGHDTTAHTISWTLFELAAHMDIQAEVRKELMAAGLAPTLEKPETRPLKFGDLTSLPVLEAVVKESMRLHPVVSAGTARQAPRDMIVGGYRIPKGTPLIMPSIAAHLSPLNFTQPDEFLPARWLTGTDTTKTYDTRYPDATPTGNKHNTAASWNPFSFGPRACPGKELALLETRTALALLIARFHFSLPDGVQREAFIKEEQVWEITLQVKRGLVLNVTPV
ncbi:hypothetical protein ABBQ38_007748 [Trebouxia sp. C0009 RCD-2024]